MRKTHTHFYSARLITTRDAERDLLTTKAFSLFFFFFCTISTSEKLGRVVR